MPEEDRDHIGRWIIIKKRAENETQIQLN